MAPDLVNKFQINCLQGSSVIERKTNYEMEGHIDLWTWVILFAADALWWGLTNLVQVWFNSTM